MFDALVLRNGQHGLSAQFKYKLKVTIISYWQKNFIHRQHHLSDHTDPGPRYAPSHINKASSAVNANIEEASSPSAVVLPLPAGTSRR